MTLPKPLETERGALGPAPDRPQPLSFDARMRRLVRPVGSDRIAIGEHELTVDEPLARDAILSRTRERLTERLRERRPNADDTSWAKLEGVIQATLTGRTHYDDETESRLVQVVDGL